MKIRLTPIVWQKLKQESERTGKSIPRLIQDALFAYYHLDEKN